MADLLAVVPEGSLPDRVAAIADITRDALLAEALAATVPPGSRRDAAKALDVAEGLITAALRRYPWLRRVYPERRGRKPARKLWGAAFWSPSYCAVSCGGAPLATVKAYVKAQQGEPPPSDGAASSPTSAAAKGRGIRGSSTGSKNR